MGVWREDKRHVLLVISIEYNGNHNIFVQTLKTEYKKESSLYLTIAKCGGDAALKQYTIVKALKSIGKQQYKSKMVFGRDRPVKIPYRLVLQWLYRQGNFYIFRKGKIVWKKK